MVAEDASQSVTTPALESAQRKIQTFQRTPHDLFEEFIELFFPEIAAYLDRQSITFMDKEVFTDVTEGETYEVDLIVNAKVENQDSFFLIHLEHQAQPQAAFDKRMFRYFARLYEKYDLPIYPIALFSFSSPQKPQPNFHQISFPHKIILEFHYDVIQLTQLNWRDFLQHQNPVAVALMARMKMAKRDRWRVKAECLRLLATLRLDRARMRLISGFVDTYLRLGTEDNQLLRVELGRMEPEQQEVVMEIVTSWMEEGLQQGRQRGRQQATLALVIDRLLPRQVGELSTEQQSQIQQLPLAQLEDLAEALLDFSSQDDLTAWMQQAQTNQ